MAVGLTPQLPESTKILTKEADILHKRIVAAIDLALGFSYIDGAHHKTWVIDQMVRVLTGCGPDEESEEYKDLIKGVCYGEDGPDTYSWDTGIAP